jgi:hypothetical protein
MQQLRRRRARHQPSQAAVVGGSDADQCRIVLEREVVQRVGGRSADEQRPTDPIRVERVEHDPACRADLVRRPLRGADERVRVHGDDLRPSARPSATANLIAPSETGLPS